MIQKVLVTPIIGLPQSNGWAQVTQSQDGTFIVSFSIKGSQAGNVGRDLVDFVSSAKPDSSSTVYNLIKKIIRFVEEKDCELQFSACYLQNGATVFATYDGALLLKRGQKLGCVLQSQKEVKLIEGKRSSGDIFILLTQAALPFKDEIFQKLQQGWDADTTVASIIPGVQNLPDSSLVSLAFLTDRPALSLDDSSAPFVQFSSLDDSEVEPRNTVGVDDDTAKEHDGNAVLGAPLLEVLADKDSQEKINHGRAKLSQLFVGSLRFFKKIFLNSRKFFLKVGRNGTSVFTKKVYVDEKSKNFQRWLRFFLISVFIAIVGLVFFLLYKFNANSQVKAASSAIAESITLFEQAKQTIDQDPIASREQLTQVISNLEAQEKSFAKKPAGLKFVREQLQEVRGYYDSVSGKQVFNELPVYYDFQLAQANFIANQTDFIPGRGFFLDMDSKKILDLEIETKRANLVDLASMTKVTDVAVDADNYYVLGEGIFVRPKENGSEAKKIIDAGKSNENAKLVAVFNQNLYVLNQEQRNIFKYNYDGATKEFSDPIRWVKSARDLDFASIVSFAVDGNIWVSTKDGQIFRFSAGEGQVFEPRGLVDPFDSTIYLATSDDLEYLYLLEPSKSRLVVLNKDGEFQKEIKSVSLAAGTGLVPTLEGRKVLIVSGTLIFEVEL